MKKSLLVAILFAGGTTIGNHEAIGQFARAVDPEKPAFTGRVEKVPQTENTNLSNPGRPAVPHLLASVRRVPLQYQTIQIAIDASIDGDTVLVSDGTYHENINFRGKKIVVASTYLTTGDTSHISQTILDGSGATKSDSASVVYFIAGEDTNSVLYGFTVRGGKGTKAIDGYTVGGGVYCTSGARLVRNIITRNAVSGGQVWGGGVDAEYGQTLIMEENIVSGNTLSGTWGGGAGVLVYNMKAIIRNNTIVDNTVSTQGAASGSHGGGMTCESGTFTIVGNLIARNRALAPTATQAASYGGGVTVRAGDLEFRNNRVTDNLIQTSSSVTAYAGGICLLAAAVSELRNMVISGNYIAGNTALGGPNTIGGGLGIKNERPWIENNIIEKNSALNGAGIGMEGSFSSSPAILVNNTIYDNHATAGGGALIRAGANGVLFNNIFWADTAQFGAEISVIGSTAEAQYCNVQGGYAGAGNIALDPLFVVGDSMFNLKSSSPCIGRGTDSVYVGGVWYRAPATDYDGHPRHRPVGSQHSDIGAQEEQLTTDVPDLIWTKDSRNPVLSGGGSTGYSLVMNPCVIYNADSSRFEMWFNRAASSSAARPWLVGYATSPDGIQWTQRSSPVMSPTPGTWDANTTDIPTVIRENGTYKMWYSSSLSTTSPGYIGYATSSDGITWTKYARNPIFGPGPAAWEAGGPYACSVMPVLGGYKIWYDAFDASGNASSIGYAISVDGISWQRDTVHNPVLEPGVQGAWDDNNAAIPRVLKIRYADSSDMYFMWYDGARRDGRVSSGLALSPDGIAGWTKSPHNPVLSPDPGAWDGTDAGIASVMLYQGLLHAWYDGGTRPASANLWHIGHATSRSPATGVSEILHKVPAAFALEQNYPNPFNPTTQIRFQVPAAGDVKLVVYDILGREVALLVNEKREPGRYEVQFDASGLASGVYLYRLTIESFIQSRKMLLVK